MVKLPGVLLSKAWDFDKDPTGWWVSEKYDGVRCYIPKGKNKLYSRNGNEFSAPASFFKGWSGECDLDGELWTGREAFDKAISIVRSKRADPAEWGKLKFLIFDSPSMGGTFEERMAKLKACLKGAPKHFVLVKQTKAKSREHVISMLTKVMQVRGEGVMLRQPGSKYVNARSGTLLKVKEKQDMEGVVVGHQAGSGKYKGLVGALEVEIKHKGKPVTFFVGSGMSDETREDPPPIGSIVQITYQSLFPTGKPRFPVYKGTRDDFDIVSKSIQKRRKAVQKKSATKKKVSTKKRSKNSTLLSFPYIFKQPFQ